MTALIPANWPELLLALVLIGVLCTLCINHENGIAKRDLNKRIQDRRGK